MATDAPKAGIHRRTDFTVTPSLKQRFERNVAKSKAGDCWPWLGALRNGYGAIKNEGKVLSSHVVAYRIAHGKIPSGNVIRHKCDNRQCCNPAHLETGTFGDNIRDMFERLRMNLARGTDNHASKLDETKVRLILAIRMVTGASLSKIGELFGVDHKTVISIVSRSTWKHVDAPTTKEATKLVASLKSS